MERCSWEVRVDDRGVPAGARLSRVLEPRQHGSRELPRPLWDGGDDVGVGANLKGHHVIELPAWTTPSEPGTYSATWSLHDSNGELIGDSLHLRVVVSADAAEPFIVEGGQRVCKNFRSQGRLGCFSGECPYVHACHRSANTPRGPALPSPAEAAAVAAALAAVAARAAATAAAAAASLAGGRRQATLWEARPTPPPTANADRRSLQTRKVLSPDTLKYTNLDTCPHCKFELMRAGFASHAPSCFKRSPAERLTHAQIRGLRRRPTVQDFFRRHPGQGGGGGGASSSRSGDDGRFAFGGGAGGGGASGGGAGGGGAGGEGAGTGGAGGRGAAGGRDNNNGGGGDTGPTPTVRAARCSRPVATIAKKLATVEYYMSRVNGASRTPVADTMAWFLSKYNSTVLRQSIWRWVRDEDALRAAPGTRARRHNLVPAQTGAQYAEMENELAAAIRFQRTQGRVVEPTLLAMLGRDILRRTRLGRRKPFKFSTWRVHACVWRCIPALMFF